MKGCREGTRQLDYLGILIDTEKMRIYALDKILKRVNALAQKLMLRGRCLSGLGSLRREG